MSQELLNLPLGQIARQWPQAVPVFHRHGFDFCCGGKRSLADAAQKLGLDPLAVADELSQKLGTPEPGAEQLDDVALIQHILTRYHEVHREQLPSLIQMAEKVERVHAEAPLCPRGLAAHLAAMHGELLAHMQKEEMILFPMIQRGMGAQAMAPISVMRHEHDDHAEHLETLALLTQGFTPPPQACTTWRTLYKGLAQLREQLMMHIHLENNVLFHRQDQQLGGLKQA